MAVSTKRGSLQYANTIIAGATRAMTAKQSQSQSTISVNVENLVGDGGCSARYSGSADLGVLANNGGPTQTAAPIAGSFVVNAGNDVYCASAPVGNVDGAA